MEGGHNLRAGDSDRSLALPQPGVGKKNIGSACCSHGPLCLLQFFLVLRQEKGVEKLVMAADTWPGAPLWAPE